MLHDPTLPALQLRREPHNLWWWEWEVLALTALVVAIYFTRLTASPVCGEESRWATGAREMIATGDWIVPRQQGEIFPERPPLGTWAMALVGLARDKVDLVAVRLPSVCAMLASTLLVYAYGRVGLTRLGSFSAAAIFATFGQVLGIGRFGESEALFTFFMSASLLIWHWGYLCNWPATLSWSLGYSFAGLAALTKGPQAPVYFVAVCGLHLMVRRDWRHLFSFAHLAGMACFAAIVGAWLIPFALTELGAVDDIWAGLARERFSTNGLFKHMLSYPFETLGCLVPWSPLLLLLAIPNIRRTLWTKYPQMRFLVIALLVTYPSVWLAARARGRYFMPMYPCIAVLLGMMIEHCTSESAGWIERIVWRRYLRGLAVVALASGAGITFVTYWPSEAFSDARQTIPFLCVWMLAAATTAGSLFWAARSTHSPRPQIAVFAVGGLLGLAYVGAIVNSRIRAGNDLSPAVASTKERLTYASDLVSFGGIYHRFAYCYDDPIRQLAWPSSLEALPPDVTYFCFDTWPGDNFEARVAPPGQQPKPGGLPFAWEKVAEIPCDPVNRNQAHRTVVVGRVLRPVIIASPSANQPVRR